MGQDRIYQEAQLLRKLTGTLAAWKVQTGALERTYRTDGWPHTLLLVNAIAFLAEAAWHHPDLGVSWAQVTVRLNTHSAGGITDKDLALAKKIEESVTWLPPRAAVLEGFAHGNQKPWIK